MCLAIQKQVLITKTTITSNGNISELDLQNTIFDHKYPK